MPTSSKINQKDSKVKPYMPPGVSVAQIFRDTSNVVIKDSPVKGTIPPKAINAAVNTVFANRMRSPRNGYTNVSAALIKKGERIGLFHAKSKSKHSSVSR